MVFINIIFNRIPFFLTCKNDIGCFDNERDLLTVKDISNFIALTKKFYNISNFFVNAIQNYILFK